MTFQTERLLDDTGWRILKALQADARLSFSELGRRVGLSAPAAAERVRRLEDAGIIAGYRVDLALEKLFPMTAIIRISAPEENCTRLAACARGLEEVVEAHRVTARALSGQIDEGIGLALEGLRSTELTGGRAFHTKLVINLGEVWLVAGRTGDAMETAQRALDLARQRHQRGFEGYALHLLGSVTCQSNCSEPARAESLYFESLALAEPRLMRPLMAHCHRGLGKLYRRTGKRQEAQERLTTATTMYREMGMTYWLEKAEAEQREAAPPQ